MYVHPAFKADPTAAETLLSERGFGTFIVQSDEGPVASHLPFIHHPSDTGGSIELHVARPNPIHELILAQPRVLLACTGPDAYMSPDWYGSPNQVPTWNYVAVHAAGRARLMDPADLPAHLERLSARFEGWLPKQPWTAAGLDPHRFAAMLNAIVGIVVDLDKVEGQWKLGQHKGRDDHEGAVAGLRAYDDPAGRAVADLMDGARGIARA
jgi:transcriptional regulator